MAVACLVVSVAYHLQARLAGVVAVETLTALLNRQIVGELSIGELQNVRFDKLVARSVVVRDAQGREVIRAERLAAWPDWSALLQGVIRIDRARVRGGEVTLYVAGEDEDTVSLAEAFLPLEPSTEPGNPPQVVVDGIILSDLLVHGDVPGLEGLRLEHVRVVGRVDAQHDIRFSVWEGNAVLVGPYAGRTDIDQLVGFFDTEMESGGLSAYARVHRGDDRVRARIRLTRPAPEAAPVMELRTALEPVRIETLAEMEIAPGLDALRGTVRGHARLVGPTDDLRLYADLEIDSGDVRIEGHLPSEGTLVLEARTEGLRLDQLIPAAPTTTVAGGAHIRIEPPAPGAAAPTRHVHAELDPLRLGDFAIPGFVMEGQLEDDALVIGSFAASHAGGETRASGRIGFDGSLDVHVSARLPDIGRDPNVRRAAPEAAGALSAELDVRAGPGAANLRVDGQLALRGFRYGDVRAERISLRGTGGGELPTPRLALEGEADGLNVGALALGRATLSVDGGPGGYAIRAHTRDEEAGTELLVNGRASVRGETWRLSTSELRVDLGEGPWRGNVELGFTPGRDVRFDPLVLARGHQRITAEGIYRFQGDDDIDVRITNVDLAEFRPLAPDALEGIDGVLDGRLVIEGDVDRRPQGRLTARISSGGYQGVGGITGEVDLALRGETLTTDVSLDLGDAGRIVAEGPIRVPPAALRDPGRLLDEVEVTDLRVQTDDFDVGPLLALAGATDALQLSGRITTDARVEGSLRRPSVRDARLILDRVTLEGWDPLRAKLHLDLDDDRIRIRNLWIADANGALATIEADLPFPLEALPSDLASFWQLARREPWSLAARVAGRRLDGWPEPVRSWVPLGLRASASITAQNDDGGISADVEGVARLVDAGADDQCSDALHPFVSLRAHLEDDLATGELRGFFGGNRPQLVAEAAAVLPFDEWVQRGGVERFPSTELVARVDGVDMGQVPWLCGYGRGPIQASLTAKDLLTGGSVVGAVLDLPRFQLWSGGDRGEAQLSTEYRVSARAGSTPDRDALSACVILGIAGAEGTPSAACREAEGPAAGELRARARLPVEWTPGQLLPTYQEGGAISSITEFARVHVEPVLSLIPGIMSGDAVMDGTVRIAGPWEGIRLEGALSLLDGQLQIEGLGQHLHGIEGHLELRGQEVVFPEDRPLTAQDAGGAARVFGNVGFEGLVPRELDLNVTADAFPIRNEGMALAFLTGQASIEGRITDDATHSSITTRNFVVRLPEQTAATLQSLGAHPDILIIGAERPPLPGASQDSYPVYVEVDARDPFWVRRSDFAALVTASLEAEYRDPDLRVGGRADIRRGTFEIFGKRFELQPGSTIMFDRGSAELNPAVNISAVYDVPGRRGVTVTVTVHGTLTNPELSFASTETNDRAEIIALLISGGRREAGTAEREASEQAASFLAGLTAGILTLGLRQEFGDVIPVLAIESEGLGGTRVRVGFNADDLIPDFLRSFVTGAYVEGFFTAAADAPTNTGGTGAFGGGVSLEFTLPEGFVLRGTYVPVDNGSLDVLFEP